MKIIGKLIQNEQFGSLKFFYGKVEERTVVCLEFYGSVCSQDFVIKLEKFVGCQSSSCMAGLWPWIGEVQVDTGYFRRGANKKKIAALIAILDREAKKSTDHAYVVYQRKTYGNVPMWVI